MLSQQRYWRRLIVCTVAVTWLRLPASFARLPQSAGAPTTVSDEVFKRIETLVNSHQFDQAERLLEERLTPDADAAKADFRLGRLYFDHHEWPRAATLLQKSLQLRNQNDQAHLLLGLTWRELKTPEKAESELIEAMTQNPHNAFNAYIAGHQLLIDEKYESSLPYFYKAIELDPHYAAALRALGMVHARLGNYELAESYYRKAVEAGGTDAAENAAAYTDLAFLLLLSHDPTRLSEGLRCARQAARLKPASPQAHYLAGKALFKLSRFKEAVPELLEAERLDPEDSKPHFLLAEAFDRLGLEEKADNERQALLRTKHHQTASGVATGNSSPGPE